MKIYLGPAGIPISAEKKDTISGLEKIKELKLSCLEVEFVRGVKMSNEMAEEVGKKAKELEIKLSIHAPYFINLCNPEKVEASKQRILQSCERAFYMRADVVVFHPGYYGKLTEEEAYELVKKACVEMSTHIENKGWNVKLGLETTGKISQFGILDEIVKICKEVGNCVPVIDFAHIYARQNGNVDYNEIFDKINTLELKHLHTHFSGIEFTPKGEKNHLPISSNKPPFESLAKEILKRKLDITIISESPQLEIDSIEMKKIFEKLGYKF